MQPGLYSNAELKADRDQQEHYIVSKSSTMKGLTDIWSQVWEHNSN